jgi:hypothetical protein
MRHMNKAALLVALVFGFSFLMNLPLENICAEQSSKFFQKDLCYDIYYEIPDGAQCVANVKILGVVEINGQSFLEIQPVNFPQEKSGYILFSSVRSILPFGTPQPVTK